MKIRTLLLTTAVAVLPLAACDTAPKGEAQRDTLHSEVKTAMTRFHNTDPTLQALLDHSVGYAIFPEVGKGGLIAGGSYGRGEAFQNGASVGYCDITQATIGLQAGAQTFSELIVFMRQGEFDKFRTNSYEFAANASAVAIKAGAARSADYDKGVVVFTMPTGGLMAEAAIGGQRFSFVQD